VKERPILFSGPIVRAILAGTKTQTRRFLHAAEGTWWGHAGYELRPQDDGSWGWYVRDTGEDVSFAKDVRCPYGVPGDRLWVRETWQENTPPSGWIYRADDVAGHIDSGWRPSIHMPRKACRLVLEVESVRVQRLQDISEEDVFAEGGVAKESLPPDPDNFHPPGSYGYVSGLHPFPEGRIYVTPQEAFAERWDSINAKRAPWDGNPFVWAITFRRCA
jgi:hypothetical protein